MCIVVGRDKWKFFLREDPAFHNEVCLWVEIMKNVEVIPSPSPLASSLLVLHYLLIHLFRYKQNSTKVQVTIEGIPMVDYMKARRR